MAPSTPNQMPRVLTPKHPSLCRCSTRPCAPYCDLSPSREDIGSVLLFRLYYHGGGIISFFIYLFIYLFLSLSLSVSVCVCIIHFTRIQNRSICSLSPTHTDTQALYICMYVCVRACVRVCSGYTIPLAICCCMTLAALLLLLEHFLL